jgi:beta-glucosidase
MNRRVSFLAVAFATALLFVSGAVRAQEAKQPVAATPAVKSNPSKPEVEQGFRKRHEGFLKDKEAALAKGPVEVLFVGDSITDGWRNGAQRKLFDERWGKHNPLNIGISGDRTQHVLWRLDNGEVDGLKPKAVVLMIGTNNLGNKESVPDTIAGVKAVVAKLREKLPESKVLLLAVFPRGNKADDPYRAQIKDVNEALAKLDDGGQHVKYLDIGPKFLEPDGTLPKTIMPDALHPNEKGYEIWAEAMGPTLDELMKS